MNFVLVFLIFSSVIAAGNARKCITCKAHDGANNCHGEEQQCDNEDDLCAKQIEFTIIDNDNRTTVSKGCFPASHKNYFADYKFKLDTSTMWFHLFSEGCEHDCCNEGPINMPEDDTTKNGHSCDSCFEQDSTECKQVEKKECQGNQIKCFDFKGPVKRPGDKFRNYAFKGCVTEDLCNIDFSCLPGCEVGSEAWYQCT